MPAEVIHHPGAGVEVPLLHFPLLEKTGIVKEGFTTRLGGVSEGIFSTMNLSFTRGDEEEAVRENYRRLASALDVDYDKFVFTDQTHTTNVRKVTAEDAGNGLMVQHIFNTAHHCSRITSLVFPAPMVEPAAPEFTTHHRSFRTQ